MNKLKKHVLVSLFMIGITITGLIFSEKANGEELYIQSEPISAEMLKNGTDSWKTYVEPLSILENQTPDDFYLGQPFSIAYPNSDTVVFPIVHKQDKRIAYTLQADRGQDNQTQLILTQALAQQLQKINEQGTALSTQPIVIYGEQNNFFYTQGSNTYPLLVVGEGVTIPAPPVNEEFESVNLLEPVGQRQKRATEDIPNDIPPELEHKLFPNWTVYETQGENPWCQFYSYAAIINNLEGKQLTSAKELVKGTFPKATDQQLKDPKFITSTKLSDSINYVNNTFQKNILFKKQSLPFSDVKKEIDQNAPLVVQLKAISGTDNDHAIVLLGYTAPKDGDYEKYPPFYYYWNPWWDEVFIASSKAPSLKLTAGTYQWDGNISNFRKAVNQDKSGTIVTLEPKASHYQTGEAIPATLKSKEYLVKQVKKVTQSNSKQAYLLDEINKWVLEQDVTPFPTPLFNKKVTLLSKASQYQTGENIPNNVKDKQYTASKVKPFRRSNSKLAYYLSGINKWVLEQDIS